MLKSDLIAAAAKGKKGGAAKLAAILGLTRQAVSKWPHGEPIPELQQFRIKALKPHWFRKGGPMHKDAA